MKVITLKGLTKRYGANTAVDALRSAVKRQSGPHLGENAQVSVMRHGQIPGSA